MSQERISHMEACLTCGATGSAAVDKNPNHEDFCDRYIGLAVRSGDVKALHEIAMANIQSMGCFGHKTGSVPDGSSSLYALRRVRIARKALEAAEQMLEPAASDEHKFDQNGHLM